MKVIDLDIAINTLSEQAPLYESELQEVIKILKEIPVIEPKKGHWIKDTKPYCSECGWPAPMWGDYSPTYQFTDYCPHCGLPMDG